MPDVAGRAAPLRERRRRRLAHAWAWAWAWVRALILRLTHYTTIVCHIIAISYYYIVIPLEHMYFYYVLARVFIRASEVCLPLRPRGRCRRPAAPRCRIGPGPPSIV